MQTEIVGSVIVIASVTLAVLAVSNYPRFERSFSFLASWRLFWLALPASRLSMIHGLMMGVVLGLIAALNNVLPRVIPFLTYVFVFQAIVAIGMFFRDYKISRIAADDYTKKTEQGGDGDAEEAV